MHMNTHHLTISPPHDCEVAQDNNSFELGESSQMQGFNLTFTNSFGMSDSPSRFDIGGHTWGSGGGNYMESQLSPQDFTVDDNFEVESSAWIGNVLFLVPIIMKFSIISSNCGILIPRNGSTKTRWCKLLAMARGGYWLGVMWLQENGKKCKNHI